MTEEASFEDTVNTYIASRIKLLPLREHLSKTLLTDNKDYGISIDTEGKTACFFEIRLSEKSPDYVSGIFLKGSIKRLAMVRADTVIRTEAGYTESISDFVTEERIEGIYTKIDTLKTIITFKSVLADEISRVINSLEAEIETDRDKGYC